MYRCTESIDIVEEVLEDLIERTALKLETLHLCEEAFNICIRRSAVAIVFILPIYYSILFAIYLPSNCIFFADKL